MEPTVEIGQAITYVDTLGVMRAALVTAIHGPTNLPDQKPGVNLVYVEPDADRHDSYGRQIGRESSVVHAKYQFAAGNYWE